MSPQRSAALSLALALGAASGQARALVDGVVDANVGTSIWGGVVSITPSTGGIYSGALIDPWHVLTAAHVVAGNQASPGNVTVNVNYSGDLSSIITASGIAVHPSYGTGNTASDSTFAWNDDVAVITLSQPVPVGVPTYGLYTGTPGLNGAPRNITLVAYGGWSDGVSASVLVDSSASVKRVGQNRVDDLLPDDEGSGKAEVLLFDFDGPTSASNAIGAPIPANLTLGDNIEAGYAGGDSGSPIFVNDNGVWKIAGIAIFNGTLTNSNTNNLQFGAIGGAMVLAPYVDWIQAQTLTALPVPEPQTYLMMLAGLGLLGLVAIRRGRAGPSR